MRTINGNCQLFPALEMKARLSSNSNFAKTKKYRSPKLSRREIGKNLMAKSGN
jgi:hypothetical protein